jgi:hypothetical protein
MACLPSVGGGKKGGGVAYQGQAECQALLAKYMATTAISMGDPWSCPNSPPHMSGGTCIRDSYVDAAVVYCWAAECESLDGKVMEAETDAAGAQDNLTNADALCSDAPVIGPGVDCPTLPIYGCS